ncbi:MAG TPA: efflux RND transporter periplasmic adaptor subunit [Rhizomicrobium sp.]|nr:efflux RND transporter periplasmic adaptor subunit [Rhizomicrobium sp.]
MRHPGRTVFVLALLLATAACNRNDASKPPPPEVGVVTVEPQKALLEVELPGRTSPYATSQVRPQVNGIIQARLFKEGSRVTAGQPLYQIDPKPYQAAYDSAAATLATAKAKATRYAALLKQKAIAPQDYDDALAAYKEAAANAEAARINLDYTRIAAPISGIIGRSLVTQGALVTANQADPLATIQMLDPIYVDINQSSSELLALKRAMAGGQVSKDAPQTTRATLILDDGTVYGREGSLEFSEVTVDQTTGTVTLRARFPNPDGLLLPGMYVRARIVEGISERAILAPQEAVSRNEKGDPTALVVDGKGIARLRLLKVSRTVGSNWLVTDGLNAGDRLIVDGLQNARPDQPVTAVPARSGSAIRNPA